MSLVVAPPYEELFLFLLVFLCFVVLLAAIVCAFDYWFLKYNVGTEKVFFGLRNENRRHRKTTPGVVKK